MFNRAMLAIGVLVTGALLPDRGLAFDAPSRIVSYLSAPQATCRLRAEAQNVTTGAPIIHYIISNGVSVVTGGSFFQNGVIAFAAPVSVTYLQNTCGFFDVTILSQNGADGTMASDDYMGIVFTAREVAGGQLYRYELALSGQTATVAINTRTAMNEPPVITAPADQVAQTDPGVATATLDVTTLGSVTDINGPVSAITYRVGGTVLTGPYPFPIGDTQVTMDATDGDGAAATQVRFQVTVTDGEAPVITPPANPLRGTDAGRDTATLDVTALGAVSDNSGETPTITYRVGATVLAGPYGFPLGDTTVTMDATDRAGNTATQARFTVTVRDGQAPVITPPEDQLLVAEPGAKTAVLDVTSLGSVIDNSGQPVTLTYRVAGTPLTGPYAFPLGDSIVTLGATDRAGNIAARASFTVTVIERIAPTVTLSSKATSLTAGDRAVVTITFSEPVTGLEGSELRLGRATLVTLSGSGTHWRATLSAQGSGDVTIAVPAAVAQDAAGNGNLASQTLRIRDLTTETTQKQITQFLQARANHLLQSQPDIATFLSGTGTGNAEVHVTQGQGRFHLSSGSRAPIWLDVNGAWGREDTRDLTYLFGAIGSHARVTEDLLLGAMVQFDHLAQQNGAARIEGTGWLAGPYLVARLPGQGLRFDARLLFGETSNEISPFGTYTDAFKTERMLAAVQLSGVMHLGQTDIMPHLRASYVQDRQPAYTDTPGNRIPAQRIALGQIEAGVSFATPMPFYTGPGDMTLTGGIAAIGSFSSGSGQITAVRPEYEGGRARVDLGVSHRMANGAELALQAFYDGIGAKGFESYGLSLGLDMRF